MLYDCGCWRSPGWRGDRPSLRVRSLGQSASAIIDVLDDSLRLEVNLPWLLAKFVERVVPTIRREATLLA